MLGQKGLGVFMRRKKHRLFQLDSVDASEIRRNTVVSTPSKNMLVKMGIFPNFQGEKKNIWNHHLDIHYQPQLVISSGFAFANKIAWPSTQLLLPQLAQPRNHGNQIQNH